MSKRGHLVAAKDFLRRSYEKEMGSVPSRGSKKDTLGGGGVGGDSIYHRATNVRSPLVEGDSSGMAAAVSGNYFYFSLRLGHGSAQGEKGREKRWLKSGAGAIKCFPPHLNLSSEYMIANSDLGNNKIQK